MAVATTAPRLDEDGVVLRAHRGADAASVVERSRDPDVRQWTRVPVPYEREDAEDWLARRAVGWQRGTSWTWAVEVDGRCAGSVELRPDGAGLVVVGFVLSAWARGRGVMSRALRGALTWAFADAEQEVAQWWALQGNWASRRVAWATGFALEGCVRSALDQRGHRRDCWVATVRAEDRLAPSGPWLEVPRLAAGAVALRGHRLGDVLRMAEACADAETQRWLPSLPGPYSLVDAARYVTTRDEEHAAARGLYWAVVDPATDSLLATVGLLGLEADRSRPGGLGRSGEVGYWCHPDARGRGVTTAAVRAASRHALLPVEDGGLGLERLVLRAAEGNHGSLAVASRAGFRRTGVQRSAERLRDGTRQDFVVHDLLADELPALRP